MRYLVASIHLALGHMDVARRHLEEVIAQEPSDPSAHYLLGVLLRDAVGDRPRAAASFGRYLELSPGGEHAAEVRAFLDAQPEGPTP